jgi:hypothetical protein
MKFEEMEVTLKADAQPLHLMPSPRLLTSTLTISLRGLRQFGIALGSRDKMERGNYVL